MSTPLPDDARCLKCGYLLRSLPENRCPECGVEFDPNDPFTFRLPTISDRTYRWAQSPSRLLLPLVAILSVGCLVLSPGNPVMELFAMPLSIAFALALVPDMVLRDAARGEMVAAAPEIADRSRFKQADRAARMPVVWLLCCICMTCMVLNIDVPLIVKFQFSRPALEREVELIRQTLPPGSPGFFALSKRVGAFDVKSIRVDTGNNFTFWLDGPTIIRTESTPIPDSIWLGPNWRMKRFHR